jgi:cytochrome c
MSRSRKLAIAVLVPVALVALAGQSSPPKGVQKSAAVVDLAALPKPIGLGREATREEVAAWDIDVRPDGQGLPPGKGTVAQGEEIFQAQCAACHGEFGEGKDRWPELAGGHGTLTQDRPFKTIGSFWPVPSTVFDYVRRAMPFGNAQSLSNDELYAVTAYLLRLNDVITDDNFELKQQNFTSIKLPNAAGFFDDDREVSEKAFWKKRVCMKDCRPPPKVTGRARSIDVTPEAKGAPRVE